MQIKRTRLRLVAYIHVLSRAAYLPNRYGATQFIKLTFYPEFIQI
jgi:hypothetical protein